MGQTFNLSVSKELLPAYTAIAEHAKRNNLPQSQAIIELAKVGLETLQARKTQQPSHTTPPEKSPPTGLDRVSLMAELHNLTLKEHTIGKAFDQGRVSKDNVKLYFDDYCEQIMSIVRNSALYSALQNDNDSREQFSRLKRMIV